MPVLTQSQCVQWVEVGSRKVKLMSKGDQSVNICTSANQAGDYEEVQYLNGVFKMTPAWAARYGTLDLFKEELRRRAYRQAKTV